MQLRVLLPTLSFAVAEKNVLVLMLPLGVMCCACCIISSITNDLRKLEIGNLWEMIMGSAGTVRSFC